MKKVAETEPPIITSSEENKLAPITAIEADIARMKTQYQGLSIKGPDDKEGFNKVAAARKDVKKSITSVDKIRKSLVDDAVKWQRQVNLASKIIIEKLDEIKRPLELMETQYILAVEQQKQHKEQQRQLKIQTRAESLLKLNARFNGTHFTLGQVSISQSAIERLEDADFNSELLLMTQESEAILAQEAADKQAQEDEKKRLKDEADKLKAAQDKLDKDRAELEALRASLTPVAPVDPMQFVQQSSGTITEGSAPSGFTVQQDKTIPSDISFENILKNPLEFVGDYPPNEKGLSKFKEMIAYPEGGAKRAIPPQVTPKEEGIEYDVTVEAGTRYGAKTPEYTAFVAGAQYILKRIKKQ